MKEEFVSGLIGGGQLCGGGISSVWRSPVKRMALVDGACGDGGDRSRTSCKRIKTTQVNGFIVYTRTRRTKFTKLSEEDGNAGFSENIRMSDRLDESKPTTGVTIPSGDMCHIDSTAQNNISGSSCINNAPVESPAGKIATEERLVTGSLAEKSKELDTETDSSSLVDVVIEDVQFVEMLHEAIPVEVLKEGSLDFEVGRVGNNERTMRKPYCDSEENRHRSFKRTTQIYKSVLRVKKVNNLVPEDVEVLAEPDFDREGLDEQTHSVSLADKSNLIRKRPSTVRELFETGVLDGVSVVYMGTIKVGLFYFGL